MRQPHTFNAVLLMSASKHVDFGRFQTDVRGTLLAPPITTGHMLSKNTRTSNLYKTLGPNSVTPLPVAGGSPVQRIGMNNKLLELVLLTDGV